MMVDYNFKAKWGGNEKYHPSESTVINVVSVKGNITIEANVSSNIKTGEPITITTVCNNKHSEGVADLSLEYSLETPSGLEYFTGVTNEIGEHTLEYTPLDNGDYILYVHSLENDYYNESDEFIKSFRTGKIVTNLTITTDKTTCKLGETVLINGTLASAEANISGAEIVLTVGTQSFSLVTNTNGAFSKAVNNLSIGSHDVKAVYNGSNDLEGSESQILTVSVTKQTTTVSALTTSIVKGQNHYVRLVDGLGGKLGSKLVVITVSGTNYNATTDSNGVAGLNINLAPGTYTITAKFNGDTNNLASNTLSTSVTVKDYTTIEKIAKTFADYSTSGVPYKNWTQKGSSSNSYMNICGSADSPIAASSGSYNTPRALKASNFALGVPNDATIKDVTASWQDSSYPTTDSLGAHNAPDFAVSSSQVQVISLGGGNTSATKDNKKPGAKVFTSHSVKFTNVNATVAGMNSADLSIILKWGKNSTGNVGRLKVNNVKLKVHYIPYQARPT